PRRRSRPTWRSTAGSRIYSTRPTLPRETTAPLGEEPMRAFVRGSKATQQGRAVCPPLIALFAALVVATPVPAEAHPVVPLNPCLDTILVNVADRDQIAALSPYAQDAHTSSIADIAATLPVVSESAEDVIMLRPDLVLAGFHNSPATRK